MVPIVVLATGWSLEAQPAPTDPAAAAAPPAASDGRSPEQARGLVEELKRAAALLDAGNSRAALQAFTELDEARPEGCADCLLGIAAASNRLRAFAAAEKAARRALELSDDPGVEMMASSLLGVSFYERTPIDGSEKVLARNMTEAAAAFRKAFEIDGGRSEVLRWNLASALEWLGDPEAYVLFSDPAADAAAGSPAIDGESAPASDVTPTFVTAAIQKPVKLSGDDPQYAERARRLRIEGVVILQTVIEPSGRIGRIRVLRGLRGCTAQAIRAVRTWRFQPATLEGEPVAVYFNLTANFQLQ